MVPVAEPLSLPPPPPQPEKRIQVIKEKSRKALNFIIASQFSSSELLRTKNFFSV
jgi:hypothetical protein